MASSITVNDLQSLTITEDMWYNMFARNCVDAVISGRIKDHMVLEAVAEKYPRLRETEGFFVATALL